MKWIIWWVIHFMKIICFISNVLYCCFVASLQKWKISCWQNFHLADGKVPKHTPETSGMIIEYHKKMIHKNNNGKEKNWSFNLSWVFWTSNQMTWEFHPYSWFDSSWNQILFIILSYVIEKLLFLLLVWMECLCKLSASSYR